MKWRSHGEIDDDDMLVLKMMKGWKEVDLGSWCPRQLESWSPLWSMGRDTHIASRHSDQLSWKINTGTHRIDEFSSSRKGVLSVNTSHGQEGKKNKTSVFVWLALECWYLAAMDNSRCFWTPCWGFIREWESDIAPMQFDRWACFHPGLHFWGSSQRSKCFLCTHVYNVMRTWYLCVLQQLDRY